MNHPLCTVSVRYPRDLFVTRQRARQVAGLLGFDPRDRTLIATAAAEVARAARRHAKECVIHFEVKGDTLHVFAAGNEDGHGRRDGSSALPRLEKRLPHGGTTLAREDAAWAAEALSRLTPFCLDEEIEQQNRETLGLLLAFQEGEGRAASSHDKPGLAA